VLPIENSLGGSIHTVYDLLLRYRLHIVGETSVAVNHCLLALPGTKPADLTRVLSHPQVRALSRYADWDKGVRVWAAAATSCQ
jgi:arogenate/prephenate dehydratase